MYGKATETAIAAISRLAEVYDGGQTRLSAEQIARSRGLQQPYVSKVLTTLSRAGLIAGTRGPGGGFVLSRPPKKIRVHEVFQLFEREDESDVCPFGGGVCGLGDPCPLHEKLVSVQKAVGEILHNTTFEVFRVAYQEQGLRPTVRLPAKAKKSKAKRASFRAAYPARGRRTAP